MEALLTNNMLVPALWVIVGAGLGYLFGSRVARKQKRELQRELNQQSLDMLDVKADHAHLSKFLAQTNRKDRLLKLTLKQLKEAKQRSQSLQTHVDQVEKQHYIDILRLRLVATRAVVRARRAKKIATRATNHLKRLEELLPITQTINAPPPKSYGQAAAVPVKVVDQHSPEALQDAIMRVSNRDSALFTKMRSSNEGQCFNSANLQAIDGIDPLLEKKLNQVGIHRVEQLANMSDSDLAALSTAVGKPENGPDVENYTAAWKGGAQRLLTQN